jgi:hypothetical protein
VAIQEGAFATRVLDRFGPPDLLLNNTAVLMARLTMPLLESRLEGSAPLAFGPLSRYSNRC